MASQAKTSAPSRPTATVVRFISRGAWMSAGLALFMLSSIVALRQEPSIDPDRAGGPTRLAWWLAPIEPGAERRLIGLDADLNDVFALRGTGHVWAVGDGGLVLHSGDYGLTWRQRLLLPPAPPAPPELSWRRLLPGHPLEGAMLLAFQSGGNPPPRLEAVDPKLTSAALPNAAENEPPQEVQASNPAASTPIQGAIEPKALARSDLFSVHFFDSDHGWLEGANGAHFSTADGGRSWKYLQGEVGNAARRSAFFLSLRQELSQEGVGWTNREECLAGDRGWSVTPDGVVVANLTVPRVRIEAAYPPGFHSADCLDEATGWAVGDAGTVMITRDGQRWLPLRAVSGTNLRGVSFADADRGWIAGEKGTLLATADSGLTWTRLTRPLTAAEARASGAPAATPVWHWLWPAPWYYLSLVLVGLVLAPAIRRPVVVAPERSVADLLVSDRPIDAGDPDPFDFSAVALGISRFLRNAKTQPPLTIAVTGEWGSGKSSLMNLLRSDLRRYGFRPVWFNAWHHQKEEHLLASLLESVRASAIPPWWRWEGASFRAKLLGIRWARLWAGVALLLAVIAFLAGYIRTDSARLAAAGEAMGALAEKATDPVGSFAGWISAGRGDAQGESNQPVAASPAPASLLALILSGLGLLVAIWKGAKGFGVNPASLLTREAGRSRVRDLEALTGFRHRFAAEFRDVTRALNPRTLLILIDDLDRCRPEMVLEVLEAVNFLVSSGDCFVVMGMARERVERCVGLSFRDVADELLDPVAAPPGAGPSDGPAVAASAQETARARRAEFARQYLEKLINIEVPVPTPRQEQSRRLILPEAPPETAGSVRRRALQSGLRKGVPAILLLALLAAGYGLGASRPAVHGGEEAPSRGITSGLGGKLAAGSELAAPAAATANAPETAAEPAHVVPGESALWPRWAFYLATAILLGGGAWRLSVPPDVVVRDSPEFESALAEWHPLLFARRNTPRAVKRFLNRVRYLAMLQRRQESEPTLGERLRALLGRKGAEAAGGASADGRSTVRIPERVLVALCAMDFCEPDWLRSDMPDPALLPDSVTRFGEVQSWREMESYRATYLEMARGIHVS